MQKPIKQIIKESGFFQWQIAEIIGFSESWFSKAMRHEPDEELRQRIITAIEVLATENKQ